MRENHREGQFEEPHKHDTQKTEAVRLFLLREKIRGQFKSL